MTPPRIHEGAAGAAKADDGGGAPDYLKLALRSTRKVKRWVRDGAPEMNVSLCSKVIHPELQRVEDFLSQNSVELAVKDLVADKGRVALLQLYAVVKQGESLVQQCCESAGSAWPKRALRLCAMKEDVLDVVLHLRWWEAVLHMVIDSETSRVRLERANREFEEMLDLMALFDMMHSSEFDVAERQRVVKKKWEMFERIQAQEGLAYAHERGTKAHLEFILAWDYAESATTRHAESDLFKDALIRCIELQKAALEDKAHLVDKALELMESFTGDARTAEYLLATQVCSLLTDMEVTDVPGLDEYKIKFSIGHGQFGVVNHVTWCGQECALKQIEYDLMGAERSEANSLKRFSHPHIVKFYRHFVACPGGDANQRRHSHIVMEKMPFDLEQHMKNVRQSSSRTSSAPSTSSGAGGGAPFSEPVAVDIMLQVAKAMWHMHSKFGVHRDLKPKNVLVQQVSPEELPELSAQGYVLVKLGDFGLVVENMMSSYPHLVMTHRAGTPVYRAPELSVDPAVEESNRVGRNMVPIEHPHMADSWSFGMMGSEIVTGDLPLVDDPPRPIRLKDMQKNVRPELPRDCPDYLRFCIESCWQYDPLERPRFADIWRMLRFAKLRSLGLIDNDMDLFVYRNRKGNVVNVRTRSVLQKPAEVHPETPASFGLRRRKTKPSRGFFRILMAALLSLSKFPSKPIYSPAAVVAEYSNVDYPPAAVVAEYSNVDYPPAAVIAEYSNVDYPPAAVVAEYSNVDYLEQSISSIDLVQRLSKDQKVRLNARQCEYLADNLTETGRFLRAKSHNLIAIRDSGDIRRKALLQLHFAVKRAEKLVRGCCCETESWLKAALTLSHVKEDIKDVLIDLHWWKSMIDIAIASVTWMSSGQTILLELLTCADVEYENLLNSLHASNNIVDRVACKDEDVLLQKVRDVEKSLAGAERTSEQEREYLLAVHVRSRLENSEVETMEELNEFDGGKLIGMGGFGAVMDVGWFGRRCALKTLKTQCKKEATSLREFQHPHIVKFFRYWEAPFRHTPNGTPRDTPRGTPGSEGGQFYGGSLQSHILMELLPMDLAQHLLQLRNMVNFTVGSKRRPEQSRGSPLPEDVTLHVMLQIVKAMWYLNNKDVAHRDLKPSNVLVRPVGDDEVPELNYRGYMRAKLADFGLVKTKALSSASSTQPKNLGTRVYGAPEVFNKDIISDRKYPRKADVWSFGIMFCELLSGKPPFPEVEDQKIPLAVLHEGIKKGMRPKLPEYCPDYLKFIIESCWELLPQDRPSFSDLLRMVRLAQVQSLGLIQKDHDLFAYKSRNGLRCLRQSKKVPALARAPELASKPEAMEGRLKDSSGTSIWWIMLRWISYNLGRRRDHSFQPLPSLKRRFSRTSDVSASRAQSESKPLGYFVNQMSCVNLDISESKLDVIFFEGNVGRTKNMSCKETWVQRDKPDVLWPRDWLPKDVGGDIRVLVLEYSISDGGMEGVLDQLQRLLVLSDRWNRRHTWERPIVLVGHSLGCVVIEHLVVALDKRVRSIPSLEDEVEVGRAKVAEAFLTSLAGCFLYAPPWTGLVPSEDLLEYVFGGLSYSKELFSDLCLDSPNLKLLSEEFVRVKRKHMKLSAVIEGIHTRGRTVVPPTSMQYFKDPVVALHDSSHSDVCKPIDKQHLAYKKVLEFVGDILENSKAIHCPIDSPVIDMEQQNLSNGKKQYLSFSNEQYTSMGKEPYLSNGKEPYISNGKEPYLSNDKQQYFSNK